MHSAWTAELVCNLMSGGYKLQPPHPQPQNRVSTDSHESKKIEHGLPVTTELILPLNVGRKEEWLNSNTSSWRTTFHALALILWAVAFTEGCEKTFSIESSKIDLYSYSIVYPWKKKSPDTNKCKCAVDYIVLLFSQY